MAKPIFILRLKQQDLPFNFPSGELAKKLKKDLSNQYHVIVHVDKNIDKTEFECYNDSKGLPNIDIYNLIKTFTDKQTEALKEEGYKSMNVEPLTVVEDEIKG